MPAVLWPPDAGEEPRAAGMLEVRLAGAGHTGEAPGRRVTGAGAEIRVRNRGSGRLVLSGCFQLENREESLRGFNLGTPRALRLGPGETVTLRCSVPAGLLESYDRLTLFDSRGKPYPVRLRDPRG